MFSPAIQAVSLSILVAHVSAQGQPPHSGLPGQFQIVGNSVASAQQVCKFFPVLYRFAHLAFL
jgi:hypothetical protein